MLTHEHGRWIWWALLGLFWLLAAAGFWLWASQYIDAMRAVSAIEKLRERIPFNDLLQAEADLIERLLDWHEGNGELTLEDKASLYFTVRYAPLGDTRAELRQLIVKADAGERWAVEQQRGV